MAEHSGILSRERTDLPEELHRVPPPPIPMLSAPYSLRIAEASDAELVADWMNRPHLVQAWECDWPVPRWREHLQAQLDGSYSVPIIGSIDGFPYAYFELYRAAKDSIATCYDADPYDIGLYVAIGHPTGVNLGLATALFLPFVGGVFALDPRCRRMMFDPDHRNAGARRLCETLGFEFLGEYDMANRRMALYALARPATD